MSFLLGALMPILLGILGVMTFLLCIDGHLYCGGSISLLAALLVVVFYALVKKRKLSYSKVTR
jgi:hypothetical protein